MLRMKDMWEAWDWWKPVALMVMTQIANAALSVLNKLAINDGMSMKVATAYSLIFASAFTVPLALILDRERPKPTWRVLFMAFLCGLFCLSLFLNLFFGAMTLTSATVVTAIFNLVPAITFIMAIPLGLEKLNLGAASGKAKVLGTIIGIGGAVLLTFYKGLKIVIWPFDINLLHPHQNQNAYMTLLHADSGIELLGVLCAVASCFSFSLYFIIQAKMSEEYPWHHSSTALISTMGAIQAVVFALYVERDWSQWKLGWNMRLLTVAYSGIVMYGVVVMVYAWCIRMRGPVFTSVFSPLQLVLVAVADFLIFHENLYLGSVLGAVLIVCGLYAVIWGQSKETQKLVPSEITEDSIAARLLLSP